MCAFLGIGGEDCKTMSSADGDLSHPDFLSEHKTHLSFPQSSDVSFSSENNSNADVTNLSIEYLLDYKMRRKALVDTEAETVDILTNIEALLDLANKKGNSSKNSSVSDKSSQEQFRRYLRGYKCYSGTG